MIRERGRTRRNYRVLPRVVHRPAGRRVVIVYILSPSETVMLQNRHHWMRFPWARQIVMKYQDLTFENAFWEQLKEIHEEWKDCDMVGVMSSTAHLKIDLRNVDAQIRQINVHAGYHHFLDSKVPIERQRHNHPHFMRIYNDVSRKLGLKSTTCAYCNYFMCKPEHMLRFIDWFRDSLRPAVMAHPLSMTNARYTSNRRSRLNVQQLLRLCGTPYYPHVPFVLERMNKCFFQTFILQADCKEMSNARKGNEPRPVSVSEPRSPNPLSIMFRRAIQTPHHRQLFEEPTETLPATQL